MASLHYRMVIGSVETPSRPSFTMTLEIVSEDIRSHLHLLLSEKLLKMAKLHKTLPKNGCLFPHNSKIQSITFLVAEVPKTYKECDSWVKCTFSIAYTCHRLFLACFKYDQGMSFRSDLIASVREARYKIAHRARHCPAVEEFKIDIPSDSPRAARYRIEISQYFSSLAIPPELPKQLREALFGSSQQVWVKDYLIPLSEKYHISLDVSQETRPKNLKGIFFCCFQYLCLVGDFRNLASPLLAEHYFNKCTTLCRDYKITLILTPPIDVPLLDATPSSELSLQIDSEEFGSNSMRHPRSDSPEFSERSVRPRVQ